MKSRKKSKQEQKEVKQEKPIEKPEQNKPLSIEDMAKTFIMKEILRDNKKPTDFTFKFPLADTTEKTDEEKPKDNLAEYAKWIYSNKKLPGQKDPKEESNLAKVLAATYLMKTEPTFFFPKETGDVEKDVKAMNEAKNRIELTKSFFKNLSVNENEKLAYEDLLLKTKIPDEEFKEEITLLDKITATKQLPSELRVALLEAIGHDKKDDIQKLRIQLLKDNKTFEAQMDSTQAKFEAEQARIEAEKAKAEAEQAKTVNVEQPNSNVEEPKAKTTELTTEPEAQTVVKAEAEQIVVTDQINPNVEKTELETEGKLTNETVEVEAEKTERRARAFRRPDKAKAEVAAAKAEAEQIVVTDQINPNVEKTELETEGKLTNATVQVEEKTERRARDRRPDKAKAEVATAAAKAEKEAAAKAEAAAKNARLYDNAITEIYSTEKSFRESVGDFYEAISVTIKESKAYSQIIEKNPSKPENLKLPPEKIAELEKLILPPEEMAKLEELMKAYEKIVKPENRWWEITGTTEEKANHFNNVMDSYENHAPLVQAALEMNKLNKLLGEIEVLPQGKGFYQSALKKIQDKKPGFDFRYYTIMPVQRFPRYGMATIEALKTKSPVRNPREWTDLNQSKTKAADLSLQINKQTTHEDEVSQKLINNTLTDLVALQDKAKSSEKQQHVQLIDKAIKSIRKINYDQPVDDERLNNQLLSVLEKVKAESKQERQESHIIRIDRLSSFHEGINNIIDSTKEGSARIRIDKEIKNYKTKINDIQNQIETIKTRKIVDKTFAQMSTFSVVPHVKHLAAKWLPFENGEKGKYYKFLSEQPDIKQNINNVKTSLNKVNNLYTKLNQLTEMKVELKKNKTEINQFFNRITNLLTGEKKKSVKEKIADFKGESSINRKKLKTEIGAEMSKLKKELKQENKNLISLDKTMTQQRRQMLIDMTDPSKNLKSGPDNAKEEVGFLFENVKNELIELESKMRIRLNELEKNKPNQNSNKKLECEEVRGKANSILNEIAKLEQDNKLGARQKLDKLNGVVKQSKLLSNRFTKDIRKGFTPCRDAIKKDLNDKYKQINKDRIKIRDKKLPLPAAYSVIEMKIILNVALVNYESMLLNLKLKSDLIPEHKKAKNEARIAKYERAYNAIKDILANSHKHHYLLEREQLDGIKLKVSQYLKQTNLPDSMREFLFDFKSEMKSLAYDHQKQLKSGQFQQLSNRGFFANNHSNPAQLRSDTKISDTKIEMKELPKRRNDTEIEKELPSPRPRSKRI